MSWWDQAIDAHNELGVKYMVQPWMPVNDKTTLDDLKMYCDYFNTVGYKTAAASIAFGYHNHDFEFRKIDDQLIYDFLLDNVSPNHVFFEMDVYWVMMGGGDPVAADRGTGRLCGQLALRAGKQYLFPDRTGDAGGSGGQERHPDRGICQSGNAARQRPDGSPSGDRPSEPEAHSDGFPGFHSGPHFADDLLRLRSADMETPTVQWSSSAWGYRWAFC